MPEFDVDHVEVGAWIALLMGATLPTLLRAVHPGTIAMTDFWWGLRPKVLTRHLGDLQDLWTLHVTCDKLFR